WISDPAPTPEEAQVAFVESASLWSAVAHLPARQREVIELFYRERLRQNEIAPRLGLSPGRVSQIHAQAIAELRHVLSSLDRGEVPSLPSPEDVPQ
ncbi:MAG: sigma-70 family RNA polymerase sigma factor, partial [Actinomycetota bacterium]|nr:sigma-70 family RNA polymerase sigma factor [Actinomycetota bacterium]